LGSLFVSVCKYTFPMNLIFKIKSNVLSTKYLRRRKFSNFVAGQVHNRKWSTEDELCKFVLKSGQNQDRCRFLDLLNLLWTSQTPKQLSMWMSWVWLRFVAFVDGKIKSFVSFFVSTVRIFVIQIFIDFGMSWIQSGCFDYRHLDLKFMSNCWNIILKTE